MTSIEEIEKEMNWVVWYDSPSETDYMLTTDENGNSFIETSSWIHPVSEKILSKRKGTRNDYRIEQRNYIWWCCTCTIVWALIALWNYINRERTKQEVEDCIQYCVNNWWYKIGKGWNTWTAMKYVRDYAKTLWIDVMYVYFTWKEWDQLSEVAKTAFENNLVCRMSHTVYSDMTIDRYDGVLDGSSFSRRTWWHSTNIIKKGDQYRVFGSSRQEDYLIKNWEKQIIELIDNWVVRNFSYVRLDEQDLPKDNESENALSTMILHWITKLWFDQFKQSRDNAITRKEMILMLYRFLKLVVAMFLDKDKASRVKKEIDKLEEK